jgi:uronate dehydrogenase
MSIPSRPVLITGASGNLGRQLVAYLGKLGWRLVLSDIMPFPDPIPAGSRFVRCDLADGMSVLRMAEGCGTILHFGGISTEHGFMEVLGPNITGLYNIYEAARREKARVLFASSNHAIGFHERSEKLDDDCQFLPDGYYGLSKAYGELMGRMYWFKHGVENVNVRIGSSFAEPVNERMLSTWLSFADLCRLCERATLAPATGSCVVWGASANSRSFWGNDARAAIGWEPLDSSDVYAAQMTGVVTDDPVTERYQGGGYTSDGFSREAMVEGRLFGK